MNRYTVNSLIGEGSFGRVYKATRKDDDQTVAIKIISKRGRSSRELKNLRRECEIQALLKHPNVIEMLESFETRNELVVVTEFALIDLHRYMQKNGTMQEAQAQLLICDLVSALYYLHSNRILHRDLKPQNVLLDEELHAKLCDFGLARNMTMGTHVLTSIKGTPLYMAPELLEEQPYDHQADLWSLGCIAYEAIVGQPPFSTTSILHLVKMIKHEDIKLPSFLSSECQSFLQGLLEKNPNLRTTWAQILCHPFVEGKLYIRAGIKAENSPFINPQGNKSKAKVTKNLNTLCGYDEISGRKGGGGENYIEFANLISTLKALELKQNAEENNCSTSRDSTNAIPPSDMENLETDLEDNLNSVTVPFAERSLDETSNNVRHDKKLLKNNVVERNVYLKDPVVNSQTLFVAGDNNMIINNFNDNFNIDDENTAPKKNTASNEMDGNERVNISEAAESARKENPDTNLSLNARRLNRNKDLEKRKLSQNLDNFSLRLGQQQQLQKQKSISALEENCEGNQQLRKITSKHSEEMKRDKLRRASPVVQLEIKEKSATGLSLSAEEKNISNNTNSPPCLMPGWDSCDESQSSPIESEEWLAFLHRSMQEILDGELDSLKQQNLVSIIVAPLRNFNAIPKVMESVAQLLSLPFVLNEPDSILDAIKTVYVDVKLVPNLMYASKLLIYQRLQVSKESSAGASVKSLTIYPKLRSISELQKDELRCAAQLYELICHLVHLRQQFLIQFCDSVAILAADELLISFLTQDFSNKDGLRVANCVLALLGCVLRELPENAELVERIIFSEKVNLVSLLSNDCDLMRCRMCMLIRLLGRYSLRSLHRVWSTELKKVIECLAEDRNQSIKKEAESALAELCQFSFYT